MNKSIKLYTLNVLLILQIMLSQSCGNNESSHKSPSQGNEVQQHQHQESIEAFYENLTSEKIRKIRNDNKSMVYAALEKLKEGQRIEVDEIVESQCEGTSAKYVISKNNEKLNLTLDVKFTPVGETRNDEFLRGVEQVKSCIPEIENFYLRYDIQFNLNIYTDDPSPNSKIFNSVGITTKNVRSNSGLYSTKDTAFCSMVLHEMGHLLGLADEYIEPGTCKTKDYASTDSHPWSLMDTTGLEVELFPRHFKTILAAVYDDEISNSNITQEKEPKLFTLTLVKDLVPYRKGPGFAELNLISKSLDFTGRLTVAARSEEVLIDVLPAGTKLVFKNTKGQSIKRRVRKRDGSLDTRTGYSINFNNGIKTRDDIYLHSFSTTFYTYKSKFKGLQEALDEFGILE